MQKKLLMRTAAAAAAEEPTNTDFIFELPFKSYYFMISSYKR